MTHIINRDKISDLSITLDDVASNLRQAFEAAAHGTMTWQPKIMLSGEGSAFQMSTFAIWPAAQLTLFHMLLGGTAEAIKAGAPQYTSTQLVGDFRTGKPRALMDGTWTSNVLPAGITRLMAPSFARAHSGVATMIGAGTQAQLNLEALDGVLPINEVRIVTRTQRSANAFSEFVTARGQTPVVMQAGPDALADADIIISTIPASPDLKPMFDPEWVTPGTFVNVVDLGRSWRPGFDAFDRVIIDDRVQAEQQYKDGRLSHGGPFDSEIGDILIRAKNGRTDHSERIALIHPGNIVGVAGITKLILERLGL